MTFQSERILRSFVKELKELCDKYQISTLKGGDYGIEVYFPGDSYPHLTDGWYSNGKIGFEFYKEDKIIEIIFPLQLKIVS